MKRHVQLVTSITEDVTSPEVDLAKCEDALRYVEFLRFAILPEHARARYKGGEGSAFLRLEKNLTVRLHHDVKIAMKAMADEAGISLRAFARYAIADLIQQASAFWGFVLRHQEEIAMARREIAKSKGRFRPSTEDKQPLVRMPGARVEMVGGAATGAQTSPVPVGPGRGGNVMRLDHMPIKK